MLTPPELSVSEMPLSTLTSPVLARLGADEIATEPLIVAPLPPVMATGPPSVVVDAPLVRATDPPEDKPSPPERSRSPPTPSAELPDSTVTAPPVAGPEVWAALITISPADPMLLDPLKTLMCPPVGPDPARISALPPLPTVPAIFPPRINATAPTFSWLEPAAIVTPPAWANAASPLPIDTDPVEPKEDNPVDIVTSPL